MACPVCAELISPGRLEDELPAHFSRTLPAERRLAPPPSVRNETRENWEPAHPDKKVPLLQSQVGRIGREVALTTAEEAAEREQRRAKIRRRAIVAAAPAWDSDEGGESIAKPRKRRRHRRRILVIWGASAALFLGVLLAAAVLLGRRENPSRTARSTPVEPPLSPGAIASAGEPSFSAVSESEYTSLVGVVVRFIAAESAEEALPLVRDQARVGPMLSQYWQDHPPPPSRLISISSRPELVSYKGLFCGFVELGDYRKRVFAMEKLSDGGFLLDWESYTGWCEIPWEQLPQKRPTQSVLVRAQLRSDDYFNRSFNDPRKHACFRLSSLDQSHRLYGYVPLESPLFVVLESKTRFSPLVLGILKIRYPNDPSNPGDQVEITEWLCDGWVLRTAPAEK